MVAKGLDRRYPGDQDILQCVLFGNWVAIRRAIQNIITLTSKKKISLKQYFWVIYNCNFIAL